MRRARVRTREGTSLCGSPLGVCLDRHTTGKGLERGSGDVRYPDTIRVKQTNRHGFLRVWMARNLAPPIIPFTLGRSLTTLNLACILWDSTDPVPHLVHKVRLEWKWWALRCGCHQSALQAKGGRHHETTMADGRVGRLRSGG